MCVFLCILVLYNHAFICQYYIGCCRGSLPYFGRMFLRLNYISLTRSTCIRSLTVTEIRTWERCGLLSVPCTSPVKCDALSLHLTSSTLSQYQSHDMQQPMCYAKYLKPYTSYLWNWSKCFLLNKCLYVTQMLFMC